ncbi:peptidase M20 domain-containing protein 2-like [Ruditapes philippinarum]|uniref:peptidase M20 domain-containing protein 2-like n=1 Tax=Ruditapes philippinarum TaxID=129788 RepID=UPI00295B983B|nr:peptidase M20 domain-containing protein 2-like [Ruditapes philippinarum]
MESAIEKAKKTACDAIDRAAPELKEISGSIWSNPELGLEEKHAHKLLTTFLEKHGFQTERSYKMETAFRATFISTSSTPNIAFISEYDALPSIGHACGHNLIAEVGVAAGLGLMAALQSSNDIKGKVTVLGTPAEEGYGGKIDLINAGAFEDIDIAMMAHPFPDNDVLPIALSRETIQVTYTGKASHAAGYPWEGINALDAAVMCYNSIACLRQQMKPNWRMHCIIKEGGVKVNIIPEKAVLHISFRAPTDAEKETLKAKVVEIYKAAAAATGCQVEVGLVGQPFSAVLHNKVMAGLYQSNLATLQTDDVPTVKSAVLGSTDMGNVSQIVPSIHPSFYIGGRAVNHTREFTKEAGDPKAQQYALIQAKVLASCAIDILMNPDILKNIKEEFLLR